MYFKYHFSISSAFDLVFRRTVCKVWEAFVGITKSPVWQG